MTQNRLSMPTRSRESGLRSHHVADGDDREIQRIGLPRRWVGRGGPVVPMQPPITLAQITKKRFKPPGWPMHQRKPLAGLPAQLVVRHMLVAGERMADQDRVGLVGIERAVGLIGDLPGASAMPASIISGSSAPKRMTRLDGSSAWLRGSEDRGANDMV